MVKSIQTSCSLNKYLIYILTLVLTALITAVGLILGIEIEDLVSDGGNIVIGIIGLYVLINLKNRNLTIGWLMYLSGLAVDLLDELMWLPVWIDDYYEHAAYGLGLLIFVNAFYQLVKERQMTADHFKAVSNMDDLTGLFNHRYFFSYFRDIQKHKKKIILLFCDLDYFKAINDAYGHEAGDHVLKEVARLIKHVLGSQGTAFRYGGEEFAILLPNYAMDFACKIAEEIMAGFRASRELQQYSTFFPITLSIGLASYPNDAITAQELVAKADLAMFYSKQKGRNQYNIYQPVLNQIFTKGPVKGLQQKLLLSSVLSLLRAIDAKDNYTGQHSEQVTAYALQIAEALSLPEEDKIKMRVGALLHDCGKIGIPDEIINKPGRLTASEFAIIKKHTLIGQSIVKYITDDPQIIFCVLYHHERWDGKGYPNSLAGEQIPLLARIIAVADAYHAMISDRPYRKALSQSMALAELSKGAGHHFDPTVAKCFLAIQAKQLRLQAVGSAQPAQ